MNQLKRRASIVFFLFLLILNGLVFAEDDLLEGKRVLLISSYNPSFITFYEQIEGIKSVLDDKGVLLDVEFMDTKRLYTEENIHNFYETLSYKLEMLPQYDVIMVSDDNGFDFVLEYGETLFSDIPVVYLGINNIEKAIKASELGHITGVVEAISLQETIEIALTMNKDADEVLAIVDGTASGQGDYKLYLELNDVFNDVGLNVLDLSTMTFSEYKQKLSEIKNDQVVILLSAFSDVTDTRVEFDEIVETINQNTSVPVFHPYMHGIGKGLIGGKVISHKEQGRSAANIVIRILNGENVDDIEPITNSPNVFTFDYQIMHQYGFKISDIPSESTLLNYSPSIILEYLEYIVLALVVIGVQVVLIVYLGITIRKRKLSEEKLLENERKLIMANDELSTTYEELYASYEEVESQNQQIQKLIYIDDLTSLDNRYAITNTIDQLIAECQGDQGIAIMFLDVDNFKDINDMFGHDVGDEVIKITGTRLKMLMTDDIHIGRFGGDEFLIVYKNYMNNSALESLIDSVREAFASQIIIGERKFYLTISMGVVKYPKHGHSQKELIKRADMSLYKAKASGKDNYIIYDETFDDDLEYTLKLQHHIKEAYMDQQFKLNYQPIIDAKTNELVGFEALIRWYHDELGHVSPLELITNAEEMGLIVDIGYWVMEKAFEFAVSYNEQSLNPLYISVNISVLQLKYQGFVEEFKNIIEKVKISPDLIILETTETAFLDAMDTAKETLEALRSMGIYVALDDFGTGYSSLNYLKNLPVNILKVDRSFVNNISDDLFDRQLIEVIVQLAKSKNLKVIAEGVEEEEQLSLLQSLGCHYIQGYYFSKPLPEELVLDYIKEH